MQWVSFKSLSLLPLTSNDMHCIVLVLIFTEALGATLDMEWHSWKTRHAKKYEDETEETERRLIWNSNFERIIEHNRKRLSFTLGLNQFADLVSKGIAMRAFLRPVVLCVHYFMRRPMTSGGLSTSLRL